MRVLTLLFVLLLFGCSPEQETEAIDPISPDYTAWVHLSWTPPTTNTDGSILTDLEGYNVYYGTVAGNYDTTVNIPYAGVSEYLVEGLETGYTYYFVLTAYNSAGSESEYSSMVYKNIPLQ